MSFSSEIKNKLCSIEISCAACTVAETAGILRFAGSVSSEHIKFTTENINVAQRLCTNIKSEFGFDIKFLQGTKSCSFSLTDINKNDNILDKIMSDSIVPFSCCRASYIRGAFLGGGSVTNPQKEYHLEFDTKSMKEATRLKAILEKEGFNSKMVCRKGYYIVYIKECETIADILGYIGAGPSALELFSIQIEKEMRNKINRRVNCESANADKAAKASSRHMHAINKIKKAKKWDNMPDVLKEIANLREENPDLSLKELGELTIPPIGKSGVNHRLNRIIEIAEEL